ncbi:FAD-dependent oxidoreductase [Sphingomonas cavernae]|uniref:FAD-dependent oxidoreductase n=1 Tax=Sphingomonas cavernae TaxID=2320861 RepID=UPI0016006A21|nr:FAD-dependent oxidoreductase [Sphingomonas cavernae]
MVHDLLIVGGGINGTAIAREAALSGLSVLLVDVASEADMGADPSLERRVGDWLSKRARSGSAQPQGRP